MPSTIMLLTLLFGLIMALFVISRPSKRFLILPVPPVLISMAFHLRMRCRFFSSLMCAWYLLLMLPYQLLTLMVLSMRLWIDNTASHICYIQAVCFPPLMMMMMMRRRRRRRVMRSRKGSFIFIALNPVLVISFC